MKALVSDNSLAWLVGTTCWSSEAARQRGPTGPTGARPTDPISVREAFTLIELLVVVATLAILAVMLLPALAGTKTQSKTTACTARFRQWAASANLYANDNRGWLPAFAPGEGGAFAWDVGTNMPNALYSYGMDVLDYFCPMRPGQTDYANAWGQANFSHPIQSISELRRFLSQSSPITLHLNDNYWVPRQQDYSPNAPFFPPDYSRQLFPPAFIKTGNPTCLTYGWPQRLHDVAVSYVPIVSDSAGSGRGPGLNSPNPASTNIFNIATTTAHFANGRLIGVNCVYADGHVAGHTPDQMLCVYSTGSTFWFY